MREIRFRCWYGGQMVQVGSLEFFVDDRYVVNDELPVAIKDISQYSGLKDKNGIDIYEGDILRYKTFTQNGEYEMFGEVVWYQGKACFAVEYMDGEHHYFGTEVFLSECLVVGNIYENEDLLTK